MREKKKEKKDSKNLSQNPSVSNDQLGENKDTDPKMVFSKKKK